MIVKGEIVVSAAPEGWMPDPVRFNIIPAVPDKENGGREVFMIPESSDLYARYKLPSSGDSHQ